MVQTQQATSQPQYETPPQNKGATKIEAFWREVKELALLMKTQEAQD